MTADAPEATPGFGESGGDPADEHATIAPPADMAHEAADEALRFSMAFVLRSVRKSGDAEALERERLVESFPQRCGRAGVRALETVGELQEAALRQRRVGEPVRLGERPADPRAQRLGEMLEDIAWTRRPAAEDSGPRKCPWFTHCGATLGAESGISLRPSRRSLLGAAYREAGAREALYRRICHRSRADTHL